MYCFCTSASCCCTCESSSCLDSSSDSAALRYAGFDTLMPGQSHTDREHVVIAVAATSLLKHIGDVEIRLTLTLRRLELRVLLVDTGSIHRDGGVMSKDKVLQFVGSTLQWGRRKRLWNNVRRCLRTMQQFLEAGLKLSHLLMMHGDFTQNLRMLDLRFQDIGLAALPEAVSRQAGLNQGFQDSIISTENRERGVKISKPQIEDLYLVCDRRTQRSTCVCCISASRFATSPLRWSFRHKEAPATLRSRCKQSRCC